MRNAYAAAGVLLRCLRRNGKTPDRGPVARASIERRMLGIRYASGMCSTRFRKSAAVPNEIFSLATAPQRDDYGSGAKPGYEICGRSSQSGPQSRFLPESFGDVGPNSPGLLPTDVSGSSDRDPPCTDSPPSQ